MKHGDMLHDRSGFILSDDGKTWTMGPAAASGLKTESIFPDFPGSENTIFLQERFPGFYHVSIHKWRFCPIPGEIRTIACAV